MGLRRPARQGGFAAIVDSLVFLAVVAIVSFALSNPLAGQLAEEQDHSMMASEAHRAMLGCQVRLEMSGAVLPRMSISELAVVFSSGEDQELGGCILEQVRVILAALVPQAISFEWTLSCGGSVVLSCGDDSSFAPSLYSSTIVLSSSGDVRSSLVVWPH